MTTKITITTAEEPVDVLLADRETGQPQGPAYTVPAHREYVTHIHSSLTVFITEGSASERIGEDESEIDEPEDDFNEGADLDDE